MIEAQAGLGKDSNKLDLDQLYPQEIIGNGPRFAGSPLLLSGLDSAGKKNITIGNYAVAVDSLGGVWAARTDGLYYSGNKGGSWVLKDAIASVGLNPSAVFVAANGDIYWSPFGTGKLRRKASGSNTWIDSLTFTAAGRGIWGITQDVSGGAYNGYIYVGIYTVDGTDDDHVYRSVDNGANWTSVYSGAAHHIHNVKADPYTGYVYACTGDVGYSAIIRSVDGGENWTTLDNNKRCIAIGFLSGIRLFGEDLAGKIYKTTDDSSFTEVYDDPDGPGDMGWWASEKYSGRIYFIGLNLTAGDIPKIISTTDGTHFDVEYSGADTTYGHGYNFISNPGPDGEMYVSTIGTDSPFMFNPSSPLVARTLSSPGDLFLSPASGIAKVPKSFAITSTAAGYVLTTGGRINSGLAQETDGSLKIVNDGTTYMLWYKNDAAIYIYKPLTPIGNISTGDASNYWNDISYKTLTDRGCLGCFDEGVELRDGRKVSDIEAIKAIKQHATKKTIYGAPMLDYKTFPKVCYKPADKNGVPLSRDENDEPFTFDKEGNKKLAADGIEMTSLFSIIIGALKEIDARISAVEINNKGV